MSPQSLTLTASFLEWQGFEAKRGRDLVAFHIEPGTSNFDHRNVTGSDVFAINLRE